ncbi:MAG: winged helix-turn-helix transcriptional regulator [Thermoanaerobaculia bacterium]
MTDAGDCGCVIADSEIGSCYCVLEPLVQAVGRRHALQVLNVVAARGLAHFNEIQEQLGGLSSSTLTVRLQELEQVGLIRRQAEDEDHPRTEYRLTRRGRALRDSLRRLFPSPPGG